MLEQQRAAHRERLASYQQMVQFPLDAPVGTPGGVSRRQMLRRLIQEYGLLREQTYLDWLEQTVEAVHRLPEDERNKAN